MTIPKVARESTRSSVAERLRGAVAFVLLAVLVVGIPLALWMLGLALKPSDGLPLTDIASRLTQPDDGSLFLGAVLVIAWLAWLTFSLSVVLEAVAVLRRVPTPRLRWLSLPQQGAAALVATAALLVTSSSASLSAPVARPVPIALVDVPDRLHSQAPVRPTPKVATGIAANVAPLRHPTVEVRRHDSLWSLAETHLGSGERFKEIVALNLGRLQPDGRALTDAHWVYPGWLLRMPVDAVVTRVDAPSKAATYTVLPGDTLSEIATDELGDGRRYPELFDLNEGRLQADGAALTDANEIRPGWRLALPVPVARVGQSAAPPPPAEPKAPKPPVVTRQPPPQEVVPPVAANGAGPTSRSSEPPAKRPRSHADSFGSVDATAPLGFGLAGIAATGLVWELRRRRRLQQGNRQLGERIAMPEANAALVEVQATAAEVPVTVESVRQALRGLWSSCLAGGRPLPDVLLVRVSATSLSLNLRNADAAAVAPFVADGDRCWRLEGAITDVAGADPYPALLTLGVDGDDLLLLNLESVGDLRISGPPTQVEEVLRAAAIDLAVGPLSGAASLTFAACFADLARTLDPGRTQHVSTPQQAALAVAVRVEDVKRILVESGTGDVLAARAPQVASDATSVDIVISRQPLTASPTAWCGSCALVVGPESSSEWSVVVGADSRATLQPLGLRFDPQTLTADAFELVLTLLKTAEAESTPPDAAADLEEAALAARALPEVPAPVLDLRDDVQAPPRVLLLGRAEVQRANDGAVPHRRRRATELIAYLALHPGASGHEIDEALWPGKRIDKATRNPFISRARQWLGRSPEGEPYLPLVVDGGTYKLRADVGCDWHDFVRFSKLGLESGAAGAMALSAALELVRGRPFLGADPATYTWAEADAQEMISAIVDVAHVLSALHYDAGDYRRAHEAAAGGLMVEPCSELLYRDALRGAVASGDSDEVSRLTARLRHELALLDPEADLDEETVKLLVASQG